MSEEALASFRARIVDLQRRLEAQPSAGEDRLELRDEILALGRALESTIAELEALKSEVRPLVDRYRELFPRADLSRGGGRVDHLGSSTYRERGWSALAGGEYEIATSELGRAVELDPDDPAGLTLLAWARIRTGELEGAERLLAEVRRSPPENGLARTVQALLHIERGRLDEAVESLKTVADSGTDRTAVLYANLYLGVACAGQNRHREAQAAFRRALELGPNLTEGYWELGCSHHAEGRIDLALEAWRAGGENHFNPWGERCREAVVRLEAERASEPS